MKGFETQAQLAEGPGDMFFNRLGRDAQFIGDLFIAEAMLAAVLENEAAFIGEAIELFPDHLL